MADIGTPASHQLSAPVLAVLPRTNWQLPKNAAFWLVTVIFGLLLFSTSAPTPLYAVYQAHWHFSPTILTIVFGVYGLGVLVALVAFGALSDRIGRRAVLAASLIAVMVSMLLFAVAHDVYWLIVARLVQGLAVGTRRLPRVLLSSNFNRSQDPAWARWRGQPLPVLGSPVGA